VTDLPARLRQVRDRIVVCDACPRLRAYCRSVAESKRAAYRGETYWGKPVPGFGDPAASIALVGLAPAAHGANRTGRMFTGDGTGGSGDFLMTALHAEGLANQPCSTSRDDGLVLSGVWMTAPVRCAPPDNKPTPAEIAACHVHLGAELAALPNLRVLVALGRIGFDACWRIIREREPAAGRRRPRFGHGVHWTSPGGLVLLASYHPSRQNTHTGRLTPPMLRSVFQAAKDLALRR
jgi:uracil-DNA glycosylase family 4